MDTLHERLQSHLHRVGHGECAALLRLHRGGERAQTLELHGLSLTDQLLHTLYDLLHHEHHHLVVGQLAVFGHVSAEALQCQRLLAVGLGIPVAVAVTLRVLVLAKVNHHWNVLSCHNLMSFLLFKLLINCC